MDSEYDSGSYTAVTGNDGNGPPVEPDELLARFILFSRHIRQSDGTIKPDAFVPHPHTDCSVSRHTGIPEHDLWGLGKSVAIQRNRTLYGRADIVAEEVRRFRPLDLVAAEPPPNHVNITNWPGEKSEQKMLAMELAQLAKYHPLTS